MRLLNRYIHWVLVHPKTVITLCLLITLALSTGIARLRFDTSVESFLPKKDPAYSFYQHVKTVYGEVDTFVVLSIGRENLLSHESLAAMEDLLEDIEAYQYPDVEQNRQRLSRLDALLSDAGISRERLLKAFEDDPVFHRLLLRKCRNCLPASEGPVTAKQRKRLRTAIAAAMDLQERKLIDEILSLFTTRDISGADDTLRAVDLIDRDASGKRRLPRTETERISLVRRLERNPAFERGLFAKDPASGRISDFGFFLRFVNMPSHDTIAREMLEIADSHTELQIITHGQPIVYTRINDYMRADLMRLIPLVMLVAAIVFAINFRSVIGVFLPLATLAMVNACILGLMGHLGVEITTVGVSLPVLMIAIGSSYSIHMLNQYYADGSRIEKMGKLQGLEHSMSHIALTVWLTGLTTFVAFMTLGSHRLSAIRDWGIFSAIGVMFSVFITLSLIPAGLVLIPHRPPKGRESGHPGFRFSFTNFILKAMIRGTTRHSRALIITVAVILAVSMVGITRLAVETEFLHYFKKDDRVRSTAGVIGEKFKGRWGFNILIDSGATDGVLSARFLNAVEDLRTWLVDPANGLYIGRTDAFGDTIKTMHMAMNNDDPAFYRIPDSDMEIVDYLEIYVDDDRNSDGRADRFEATVDPNFREVNILARLHRAGGDMIGTGDLKRIFAAVSAHLAATLPDPYTFRITGHPGILITSAGYIVNGQLQSLALSLAVIWIVVVALLKNVKAGLMALIPMSTAVIINFGIMGWFGIRLDIATSIIAAITIGIGVDDTIHFINTYRFFRTRGMDRDATIRATLELAGKAILFTSFALIFGFSVMGFSKFKPLVLFGILMSITMIATTVGALLLLPSAIKRFGIDVDKGAKKVRTVRLSSRQEV
ncbi:MMPL family transporter [uncultured Desulfosarcina sp.]|uniref:efflux RND transporter permease subunit n=1 Tax=uncultured Desulfosarcina sp. TaxID=218289 RepID=UPI0029C70788|nr:MMPL family transporter [uncultured Desulfosarcina sp.]